MPDPKTEEAVEQGIIFERLNNFIITATNAFNENKEAHRLILEQTTKTNGKVIGIMSWKDKITGGFIVINVIVIPVVLWLVFETLKSQI